MASETSKDIHEPESQLLQLEPEEYEQLWAEEADARYADFLAGRTSAVDGDDVFARARARLR